MAELTQNASNSDCIFGTKADPKLCKSESADRSAGTSPLNPTCPECGSKKLYKDGLRHTQENPNVQRWLCRDCNYRFSQKPSQEKQKWSINTPTALPSKRQICVEETKNLVSAPETKTVAGETEKRKTFAATRNIDLVPAESRGLLIKFMAYLEREGFDSENQYPTTLGHLVKDGANLLDPENVKAVIAKQKKRNNEPWSDSMKMLATCAYDAFCQMQQIHWNRPTYRQSEATIYVPDEKDLDLLISRARKKMSTFLGCLKETFADPSEILSCDWIDLKDNVLSINHPVKGHLPGKCELTPRLTMMLNSLPHKEKRIFTSSYKAMYSSFHNLRTKDASEFQNPTLLQISFKSFRHWGGSMVAELSNGNTITIMRVLRHKSFKSSLRYIHTINFKDQDYEETVATTPDEIRQLGKAGWTKYDEVTFNGIQMHFYRKPKRFGGFKKLDTKSESSVDRFLCAA